VKRRLSDADELAFWHLGRHASTWDDHRVGLQSVQVVDGWAWASDSFRMLCVPVEATWSGSVHRSDALRGGTVEVAGVDDDTMTLFRRSADQMAAGCHHDVDTIPVADIAGWRRWLHRAPRWDAPDLAGQWDTAAMIAPGSVFGDSTMPLVVMPGPGPVTRSGPCMATVRPAAVQAPYLAQLATALHDLSGLPVTISGAAPHPLILQPAAWDDPPGLLPWGALMPVRIRGGYASWPRPTLEAAPR